MKKYILFTILFLSVLPLAFAEISIKAEVSKKTITTDEALTYKITIASSEKTVPLPKLAEFDGFNIISRMNSTSFNLSAGTIKYAFVFVFILAATKTGEIEIPPAKIRFEDKDYSTDAFKIMVLQGKNKPQPKQKKILPQGTTPNPEETTL